MSKEDDLNDSQNLQSDLNVICNWAQTNNMFFNCSKFHHMRYGCSSHDQIKYIAPDDQVIPTESQIKDLEILMSSGGNFGEHIDEKSRKAKQISGLIFRTCKTREAQPMILLFKSLVLPILEYCCQLWSDKLGLMRKLIEKFH